MTHRVLNKHKAKSLIQIYSDVMKTIQCAHPPHHHNGFVATCRWRSSVTASGGVSWRPVVEWRPLAVHSRHVTTKPLWWWGGWAHWIVFMTSLYICIYVILLRLNLSILWWLGGMVVWGLCVIVVGLLVSRGC